MTAWPSTAPPVHAFWGQTWVKPKTSYLAPARAHAEYCPTALVVSGSLGSVAGAVNPEGKLVFGNQVSKSPRWYRWTLRWMLPVMTPLLLQSWRLFAFRRGIRCLWSLQTGKWWSPKYFHLQPHCLGHPRSQQKGLVGNFLLGWESQHSCWVPTWCCNPPFGDRFSEGISFLCRAT